MCLMVRSENPDAGKVFFVWVGPMPVISISKPELIKEAFTNMHDFQKAKFSPIFDKLFPGLVSYEGQKWAQHRKIINPAFHTEKLKVFTLTFRSVPQKVAVRCLSSS